MLDFLTSVVPCKWTKSKKLKSHDIHSNTYNYKITYSVEIVPICKGQCGMSPSQTFTSVRGNFSAMYCVKSDQQYIFN
ncbi:hypothetical protein Avbf_02244 [Armadillidium vulgare]|nr:hypothetical protein Avbf_02244 [Armadillidium vulgare]